MSQHSSLKFSSVGVKHRNVLKRYERIKKLKEISEKWEERKSAFGLPKIKSLKIKVRKTKSEKAEDKAAAPGETAPQAPQVAVPPKPVTKAKEK